MTPKRILLLAYLALLAAILFSHSSCYSAKKAGKQLDKAMANYPELSAEKTRDRFPCTTVKVDTLITTEYELLEIECPGDTTLILDTVTNEVVRTIVKPGKVIYRESPVKTITRTVKVEDSAKIYLAVADREKAEKERDKYKAQSRSRGIWALILGGFALLFLLFIIALIKRR